jgi:UPF0716 protein FxsA
VLLLLILWPIAELFVMVEVAMAIGVLPMLGLLIIAFPLGAWAMRSQGRAVWRRLAATVNQQQAPGREVVDGALVLIGGALIMIPGFIGDAIGLVCLLPPTRALLRNRFVKALRGTLMTSAFRVTGVRSYDVDSTARDVDPPSLRA